MSNEINSSIKNVSVLSGNLSDEELYLIRNPEEPWAGMALDFQALDTEADVQIGTGGLTTAWASGGYRWDAAQGIYVAVAPNTPVWNGSELLYYPEATNVVLNSRDLSRWSLIGTPSAELTEVGIDGVPNSATLASADNSSSYINQTVVIADSSNAVTYVWHIKKDTENATIRCRGRLQAGTTALSGTFSFNSSTGAITNVAVFTTTEVVSIGGWWKVLGQLINNSSGNTTANQYLYPAETTARSVTADSCEIHLNKTIPEVRALPPIFTEGTAVTMDRTDYSFDIANHDNDNGIWVCDWRPSFASSENPSKNQGIIDIKGVQGKVLYANAGGTSKIESRSISGIVNSSATWERADASTISSIYHLGDALATVRPDPASEGVFTGFNVGASISLFAFSNTAIPSDFPATMKNLRRYSITSYIQGKSFVYRGFPPLPPPPPNQYKVTIGASANRYGYINDGVDYGAISPPNLEGLDISGFYGNIADNNVVIDLTSSEIVTATKITLSASGQTDLELTWSAANSRYQATDSTWANLFQSTGFGNELVVVAVAS